MEVVLFYFERWHFFGSGSLAGLVDDLFDVLGAHLAFEDFRRLERLGT